MTTPIVRTPARGQRKRPTDKTGIDTERLNAELKEERAEAAQRVAMVTAERIAESNEIVDYFPESDKPLPKLEVREVELNDPGRIIRVNTDIDQMVFGREVVDAGDPGTGRPPIMGPIKFWNFKEGQSYRVNKDMAEHLDRLGYLSYLGGA
jgi:hypothetical protein